MSSWWWGLRQPPTPPPTAHSPPSCIAAAHATGRVGFHRPPAPPRQRESALSTTRCQGGAGNGHRPSRRAYAQSAPPPYGRLRPWPTARASDYSTPAARSRLPQASACRDDSQERTSAHQRAGLEARTCRSWLMQSRLPKSARIRVCCGTVRLRCRVNLSRDQQITLARSFANLLRDRYDTPIAWAVHEPDKGQDERNIHAHLIVPTRSLNEAGDAFGAKLRVLDSPVTSSFEITQLRNSWADLANAALIQSGRNERVNVGRKCEAGHRRHAKPSFFPKTPIRRRARALLQEVRQLVAVARDDWVVGFRNSFRKYFGHAYAQIRLPAWTRAIIKPSKQPDFNPLAHEGLGSSIRSRRAVESYRQKRRIGGMAADRAVARTRNHQSVLISARYTDGRIVELEQQADGKVTAGEAGFIGRVFDGQLALNHAGLGKALADCLGSSNLSIGEFTRQVSDALHNDGAHILHAVAAARSGTTVASDLAEMFRPSAPGHNDGPTKYDAAWAEASLRETFRQQREGQYSVPRP